MSGARRLLLGAATAAALLGSARAAWATSDCTDFRVVATHPPDDRVVPRAAILRASYDHLDCAGSPALRVMCAGTLIASSTTREGAVLEAPLPADAPAEGTPCTLEVWDTFDEILETSVPFTIGGDQSPPPPPAPRLVSSALEHHRTASGDADPHRGSVMVEVDADPLGMTLVRVVDPLAGEVRAVALAPAAGGTVVLDDVHLLHGGGEEACFRIEAVDAVGAAAGADACAPSTPTETADGGCSAAGSGSPRSLFALAAVALLAVTRRRW